MNNIFHYFQIDMAAVLDYQPGRAIPQIEMKMSRKQVQEEQLLDEYVTVNMRGVHEPASIRLICSCHTATTS